MLTRIDELGDVKLQSLDKFYKNRQSPSGFTIDEFNFPATKYFDEKPVTINFRKGMPDLRDHSPVMNFTDGTPSGKFKFESNSLNGKTADFTAANTALAKKFGIEKIGGNWPKNAQGFVQKGNYRWNPSKTYFDVFDPSTQKWVRQTWHHFEDGTTMFPVSSKIHSNPGGFSHSGGKSIIDNGLQNIFEFLGF